MLGQVAHAQGDYDQAQSRYDQVVALMEERGGIDYRTLDVSPAVLGFARLAVASEKPHQAARLFGAAHTALANPYPDLFIDRCAVDRDIAAVRLHLGELAFAVAFAEGRGMTSEQAVAYAVDGRTHKPSAAQLGHAPAASSDSRWPRMVTGSLHPDAPALRSVMSQRSLCRPVTRTTSRRRPT